MRAAVPLAMLASGCQLVFGLDPAPVDPDAGPDPLGPCSSIGMITDDFEDGAFDPWWTPLTLDVNRVEERGGIASLTVPGTATGIINAAGLVADALFDLREQSVSVEVTVSEPSGFALFDLAEAGFETNVRGNGVAFVVTEGMLQWGRYTGGTFQVHDQTAYDPVQHRVWQISHDGVSIHWAFAPGRGEPFVELGSQGQDWVGFVEPRFAVFDGSLPSTMTIDQFNGAGPPRAVACPAETLPDGFEGSTIALDVWGVPVPKGCTITPDDTGVVIETQVGAAADCGFRSTPLLDLVDSELLVQVEPDSNLRGGTAYAYLDVELLDGTRLSMAQDDVNLQAGILGQAPKASVPYDRGEHRWWRVRAERQGTIERLLWETSPDGVDFALLGETVEHTGLDKVRIRFGVEGTAAVQHPTRFSAFNAPP